MLWIKTMCIELHLLTSHGGHDIMDVRTFGFYNAKRSV